MNEICENLKAGDKVFVSGGFGRSLHEVEKITPKGFIKVCGSYYNKNGYERGGDSWNFTSIEPATAEEIKEFNRQKFIKEVLSRIKLLPTMSYEKAVEVNRILFGGESNEELS